LRGLLWQIKERNGRQALLGWRFHLSVYKTNPVMEGAGSVKG